MSHRTRTANTRQVSKTQPEKARKGREKEPQAEAQQAATLQLPLPFGVGEGLDQIRNCLLDTARQAALKLLATLVEDEVATIAGTRHQRRGAGNPHRRHGHVAAKVFIDGQPVAFQRPRVRDTEAGSEIALERMQALQSRDALDADVLGKLVRGVSTRNYDGALTAVADGLGMQKSAVSDAFIRASQKDLDAINTRRLDAHTFVAIFIDGTPFAGNTVLCALGVTTSGEKLVLGLRDGASENTVVVNDLLADLNERGLTLTDRALFILDGSKALHRAVRDTFGDRAVIQRCLVHKKRNVESYLPTSWHAELRQKLNAAWDLEGYDEAKRALSAIERWLRNHSESAARSLAEGLEETLALHRLGVTGALRRTLRTTNPIESLFSVVEEKCRRVKRWRDASMVLRWVGSACAWHEPRMRRVRGHADLGRLITALKELPAERSSPCRRRAV